MSGPTAAPASPNIATPALRIAYLGLRAHPTSASRHAALALLQARYQHMSPFRFIIYSGWSGRDLAPLTSSGPHQSSSTTS